MKTIAAAVLVAFAALTVASVADAKQPKRPLVCTTTYVLGGTITTCR